MKNKLKLNENIKNKIDTSNKIIKTLITKLKLMLIQNINKYYATIILK